MWLRKKPIAKATTHGEFLADIEKNLRRATGTASNPDHGYDVQVMPGFLVPIIYPGTGNDEHQRQIKKGVKAWNEWRDAHPDETPNLQHVDLAGFDLSYANLEKAMLYYANLRDTRLKGANLTDANLFHADVSGAELNLANFTNACVFALKYNPGLLRGRCHGTRCETTYGNARFKRDVLDQDYIDQVEARARGGEEWDPFRNTQPAVIVIVSRRHALLARAAKIWAALTSGFGHWRALLAGALVGILASQLLYHGDRSANRAIMALAQQDWRQTAKVVLGFTVAFGFLAGTVGRLLIFKLWALFDYGRSWGAVLAFAILMVAAFGAAFCAWDGVHIQFLSEAQNHAIWYYPWFVATMGFATLGISSYAMPLTNVGAVLMMANVLSGFLTLGLLLSVLGNIFARRA